VLSLYDPSLLIMNKILLMAGREIKGVAFDLEGTVVNLEPLHFAAHVETAKNIGVELNLDDPRTLTELVPNIIGGPPRTIMEQIIALKYTGKPIAGEDLEKMIQQMLDEDREIYLNLRQSAGEVPPREGFLEVLQDLRRRELPVTIGSYTSEEDATEIFRISGLDKLFDRKSIILKEDVKNIKPNPEVYLKTARMMGIDPKEQLVFEDSPLGTKAGAGAGSIVIGMPVFDNLLTRQALKDSGANLIFGSWNEVSLELRRSKEGNPSLSKEGTL